MLHDALQIGFWLSVLGSASSYFVYPALLRLLPRREIRREEWRTLPRITLLIAARNEERRIAQKLDNALSLDYPRELLEIIVASDCSDDDTDGIVLSHADRGVRLVRTAQRGGKEAAQREAIAAGGGELFVFTDSATRMETHALRRIVAAFADPGVGAVSSTDRVESAPGSSSGEGAYVRYEMWLRQLESERGGLVGLSGSLFAVRRAVTVDWPTQVPSDITAALRTASLGLRAIADPELYGYYADLTDASKEYERKVRTVIRGMAAVAAMGGLLNPARHGAFAVQLWGHKVLRWATPWFLVLAWGFSALLAAQGGFYLLAFVLQTLVYLTGLLAWAAPALRGIGPVRLIYYLIQVHLAMLQASLRYLRGERIVVWSPSVR